MFWKMVMVPGMIILLDTAASLWDVNSTSIHRLEMNLTPTTPSRLFFNSSLVAISVKLGGKAGQGFITSFLLSTLLVTAKKQPGLIS